MESRNKEITPLIENEAIEGAEETSAPEVQVKKRSRNPIKRAIEGGLFNLPFKILCWIFIASAVIYIASRFITPFAEFWTKYPAQWMRFLLSAITGWFNFSFAECFLVLLPIIAIAYMIASSASTKRDTSDKNYYRWLRPMFSVVLVILIIFFSAFGPAYSRNRLAKNLDLSQNAVTAEELYSTSKIVLRELSNLIDGIDFDTNGASIMPYDYRTLVDKVNDAFEKYAENADYISHFDSNPKVIALSEPMTYTHISGVYTFMTGESNINTNYPDFLMPFTMAHEMAHQRGIAREDEANFVAFLVCIESDDVYIRYCGYANLAHYLNSALSSASKELYSELIYTYMPQKLTKEFVAYSEFFDKYRDSTASTVTGTVNDVFLQSQGQQEGTRSYGLVVDLAVAYYKE